MVKGCQSSTSDYLSALWRSPSCQRHELFGLVRSSVDNIQASHGSLPQSRGWKGKAGPSRPATKAGIASEASCERGVRASLSARFPLGRRGRTEQGRDSRAASSSVPGPQKEMGLSGLWRAGNEKRIHIPEERTNVLPLTAPYGISKTLGVSVFLILKMEIIIPN